MACSCAVQAARLASLRGRIAQRQAGELEGGRLEGQRDPLELECRPRQEVVREPGIERAQIVDAEAAPERDRQRGVAASVRLPGFARRLAAHREHAFEPDAALRAERDAWREEFLARILRVVHVELEADADDVDERYQSTVEELASQLGGESDACWMQSKDAASVRSTWSGERTGRPTPRVPWLGRRAPSVT